MMKCPFCSYNESKVIDSRPADEGTSIRRRRECLSCGKRFTTYETVESLPMVVVKKDGSRQSFDKRKVLGGMIRACEKRPVPFAELEKIADEIEQDLQNSMDREISTEIIGERVMEKLRMVDQVAYVRFASVYRQFKDMETVRAEVSGRLSEKYFSFTEGVGCCRARVQGAGAADQRGPRSLLGIRWVLPQRQRPLPDGTWLPHHQQRRAP